jgi:hypothetical protein
MFLPWDALTAGLAVRAGIEGWAPLPGLGLLGLAALLAPALGLAAVHIRRTMLGDDAPGIAERAEVALAGDSRRLRLVGVVCGLIGLLFLFVALQAVESVALRKVFGLFLGAALFLAVAVRCFALARRR